MGCACGAQEKTNHKFSSLSSQLKHMGYKLREMKSDGNCLFRAISHQLENDEGNHAYYRKEACDYIKANQDYFKPFIEDETTFEDYVHRMSFNGIWGGNLELYAIAMRFEIEIHIHILNQPVYIIKKGSNPKKVINLGFLDKEHYNSVVKIESNSGNKVDRIEVHQLDI